MKMKYCVELIEKPKVAVVVHTKYRTRIFLVLVPVFPVPNYFTEKSGRKCGYISFIPAPFDFNSINILHRTNFAMVKGPAAKAAPAKAAPPKSAAKPTKQSNSSAVAPKSGAFVKCGPAVYIC